jgi:hypothetical protein
VSNDKPPSPRSPGRSLTFLLGQDSRGRWVAQDRRRQCGGLFVSRAQALKFALFENGNRPHAVIAVAEILELDLGGIPQIAKAA